MPRLTPFSNCSCTASRSSRSTKSSKNSAQIRERIAELREILGSEKKLKAVIVAELREVMKFYGDDRRTQIVDRVEEIKLEDLIKDEEMAITVSHAGYIKRTSVDVYRHQSRGGKGRIGAKPAKTISSSTFSSLRRTATFCSSLPRAVSTG